MKPAVLLRVLSPSLLLLLSGCGDGAHTADVVQAATKGVVEVSQQLAEQAAALADMTPEAAKAKMQEVVDYAAKELRAAKDSEAAHEIARQLELALDQLVKLGHELGAKLNLAAVQQAVTDLIVKFKNDPRVVSALEAVERKLGSFTKDEPQKEAPK